ncbi:unnamed protein product [Rotaria sordida]|uniref:Uncharacterized protein n=1 Tax=Rotaria sordida TaxID=392033 RepID=A0A819VNB0_9BILA|nr:unnamed protein product [Rotaria sordida]CAF4110586.1 unnamed protein product [Rotaria sordida]
MDMLTTSYSRVRRSTAGINKRYDEQDYVLVSFPKLNKHSIVPVASVTIDPLDKQNGSIKTFGSRKNLRIIGSGSKEEMKERASRYAASAGSEEVELGPDEQEDDENQCINKDDDDYSPSPICRTTKEIKKRVMTSEQSKSQIEIISSNIDDQPMTTSAYDGSPNSCLLKKNPLVNRQLNFDRLYPSPTRTKRSYKDDADEDESSLSGSDEIDSEYNKNSCVIKKNNELQALLKKPHRKRKKQITEPVRNVEGPCSGCIKLQEVIMKLSNRVDRLEKVIPVIKKFRSKSSPASTNQINTTVDNNEIYENIEKVTGVDPNRLRSTSARPTMIMRELIKKAGHINDKAYLDKNEDLFKQFIQMKCMILDDNIADQWKEIKESLGRQHIDEANNKKKRISKDSTSTITNITLPQVTQTSTANKEQEAVPLATVSESF